MYRLQLVNFALMGVMHEFLRIGPFDNECAVVNLEGVGSYNQNPLINVLSCQIEIQ